MGRVLKLVINELIISNLITNSFQNEIMIIVIISR